MYDAILEQMLEQALSKASTDYLQADTTEDKENYSRILCDVSNVTIKLIGTQDARTAEEAKLAAASKRDARELELKLKQIEAAFEKEKQELKLRAETLAKEQDRFTKQLVFDWVKLGTGFLITVGLNLIYIRFDAKGNMFTTSFGRKRAEESTRLKF